MSRVSWVGCVLVGFSWYATLPSDPGPGSKSEKCILAAFDTINGQRKRHARADDILESMNRFVLFSYECGRNQVGAGGRLTSDQSLSPDEFELDLGLCICVYLFVRSEVVRS